jgi:hypothetical protein
VWIEVKGESPEKDDNEKGEIPCIASKKWLYIKFFGFLMDILFIKH